MGQPRKALKDLVELGKEYGYITLEEINRSLTNASMSSEEIDNLMTTLEDLGIDVVDRKKYKQVDFSTIIDCTSGCCDVYKRTFCCILILTNL